MRRAYERKVGGSQSKAADSQVGRLPASYNVNWSTAIMVFCKGDDRQSCRYFMSSSWWRLFLHVIVILDTDDLLQNQ
jgi:hypothetical protein